MKLGIDVGSTTVKLVLLNENNEIKYSKYERHMSNVFDKVEELVKEAYDNMGDITVKAVVTGSGGLALAEKAGIPFEQEVITCSRAVEELIPETETAIELGGEDAKIIFLTGGFEMRMNGTCAGGTGAFIDQMAALMQVTPDELDSLASHHEKICTIASRCGVFAKSDVKPLLNQGARKEDIAAGIFYAVVGQTIAGLAQG